MPKITRQNRWTSEDEYILRTAVLIHGKDFSYISEHYFTKFSRKACGERWRQQSDPDLDKTKWTNSETIRLLQLYDKYGPRWTEIQKHIPRRSTTNIKNNYRIAINKIKKQKNLTALARDTGFLEHVECGNDVFSINAQATTYTINNFSQ